MWAKDQRLILINPKRISQIYDDCESSRNQLETFHATNSFRSHAMKAAIVEAFDKPLVLHEWNTPTPKAGQILVKTEACGVCHTDLHAARGDWPVKPKPPFIPGHEGIGRVAAIGAGVINVKEGDRVGVPWLYSKPSVEAPSSAAIQLMAVLLNIFWLTLIMWRAFLLGFPLSMLRPSSVPA
jgi:Alcohol dehydrogenase GroES-like domain